MDPALRVRRPRGRTAWRLVSTPMIVSPCAAQQAVRDLRQHRVGQVLHHQRHAVRPRPAEAEQGAGLRLAGLERHAGPAQPPPHADERPVVRALVHEQRLARRHRAHVERMALEVVGKGLFDIEEHPEDPRVLAHQAVENFGDVRRIGDGAVEIAAQPVDSRRLCDPPDPREPRVVPSGVVAAQFDLEAFQPVTADPVGQQHGVAVVGFAPVGVLRFQAIAAADQMPGRKDGQRLRAQEIARVAAVEGNPRTRGRLQVAGEVAVHPLGAVGVVDGRPVDHAVGVVQRQVEGGVADQRRQPGHGAGRGARAPGRRRQTPQFGVDERLADFQRVPRRVEPRPGGGQGAAEIDQHALARCVRQVGRPDPLHAQRGLSPAHGATATDRLDFQTDARAGDPRQRLHAEFQRHAGLHRQQIELRADHPDIARVACHLAVACLHSARMIEHGPSADQWKTRL